MALIVNASPQVTVIGNLGTDTVLTREAAWLTAVDGLPSLLVANGGPFDVVQAYWPRQPGNGRAVYVTRNQTLVTPDYGGAMALNRMMSRHGIRLRVWWGNVTELGADQQAFDTALDSLLARVLGVPLDPSHGMRFLDAARSREGVRITYSDPEQTAGQLRADVTYVIDDTELIV